MIKIIKEGKIKKFKKTCPDCGCEFEYEASDLITDRSVCLTTYPPQYGTYVVCPCCGKHIHHGVTSETNSMNITLCKNMDMQTTYGCDGCPNKPDPNKITAGDTPCTWCKKNQPYCSNNTTDYTNYVVDLEIKELK